MNEAHVKMHPWVPTTDLKLLRRFGKLIEELGELSTVAGRCIIQGIDEIDPSSGKVNRQRLEEELADVLAQCSVTIEVLRLSSKTIWPRVGKKERQMAEWEAFFQDESGVSSGD